MRRSDETRASISAINLQAETPLRDSLPVARPSQVGVSASPPWVALNSVAICQLAGTRRSFAELRSFVIKQHTLISCAVGGYTKRAMDLCIAAIALVLLAPVMLVIAIAIKATLGGPIVFAHTRVGQTGRSFSCFKFRSMVVNGDQVLEQYLLANPEAATEWRETRKLRNDPRITSLGHALRKTSLDELPQLFNILRGDMSCVGPRPVVNSELERFGDQAPYYLASRPGLTGIWQVSGRSNLSYQDRVELDAYYVRNWSLWLDVRIMAMTIPAVLRFSDTA